MGLISNFNRMTNRASGRQPRMGGSLSYSAFSQNNEEPDSILPSRVEPVKFLDEWTQSGMGILGEAMMTPGRIVEAPFSLMNNVVRGLTGDWFGGKGIDVAEGIGKGPVGDIFKWAGDVTEGVMNIPSALINSQDTDLIYKYRGKGDDFIIPDFGEITEGGILGAIPGLGGFFGRQKTLGELKNELYSRGFTDQDFADVQSGRRSIFDYGDKLTNDNLILGLGMALVADPTNLLFFVPGANIAKGAAFSARLSGLLNKASTVARRGDVAFDVAKASGRLPDPVPVANVLAKETINGKPTGVLVGVSELAENMVTAYNRRGFDFRTLGTAAGLATAGRGTAKFLLDPKGYQTRVGFYKRAAAIYGAELAVTALPDGILQGLQDFAQESLDKRPMSNNVAFMLGAAMTIPFREFTSEAPKYWRASVTQTFDNTIKPSVKKTFGSEWEEVVKEINAITGGVDGDQILQHQIMASTINLMIDKKIDLSAPLRAALESMQERGDTSLDVGKNLNIIMFANLRTGAIRADEIMAQVVKDWQNSSALGADTIMLPNDKKVVLPDLMVQRPWDRDLWVKKTAEYSAALKMIRDTVGGNPSQKLSRVTIGLRNAYTKEQIETILIPTVTALGVDGVIPLSDLRVFLSDNDILFKMVRREQFARYLGEFPDDTVPVSTVVDLLKQTMKHKDTPTNADYYWKDIDYQTEAILSQPDGPMQQKLQMLADKVNSTLKPDGTIKPGKVKKHKYYREKLRREVAWRIERGDADSVASPRVVATALRAELARMEARLIEESKPRPGMVRVYRGEGGTSKSAKGGRWFSESREIAESYNKKGQPLKYVDLTADEVKTLRSRDSGPVDWLTPEQNAMVDSQIPAGVREFRLSDDVAARQQISPGDTILEDLRASIKYFDNRAKGSSGAKSHPEWVKEYHESVDGMFPTPRLDDAILKKIPEWYLDEMRTLTDDVWKLSKNYTVTLAPKDAYLPKIGDTLPEAMLKQRSLVGRVLYDNSVLGAPARVMDFLLRPVSSSQMLADAEQSIMNEYIGVGAKPDEVRQFLSLLREEAIDKHAINATRGYRVYGSVKAILPHTVNYIAAKVWDENSSVQRHILPGNHHRVIDRAGSRMLRDLKERNRIRRSDRAKLSSLVNDRFWNAFEDVQYTIKSSGITKAGNEIPVATQVLSGSRLIGNTLYHLFRFMLDPRYWLMNHFEHVIIGSVRDGMGNKTNGYQSPAFNRVAGVGQGLKPEPADLIAAAGSGRNKPSYLVDGAETGMFHGNRAVAARIAKTFDAERPKSVFKVLEDMDQSDPALVKLKRDFGVGDNRSLAEIIDEQWFNFDQKGVAKTVREQYLQLFRDEPQTAQAMAESALIVQRITDVNQALYDDLVKTYLGNPNRNTIERVLNSYWLFWPLSYQLKASKWLVRAMTMQAFGRDANALGLFQYGQLREFFTDQLISNEEFARQFEGQEHLWQTAAMFFPITPEDIGVSLSRPTRTFGSMFFPGWFDPTFGTRDPIAGLAYTFEIGPMYTLRLLRSLSATIFPEGTDLSIIEPQIPDLDMDQFASMFPKEPERNYPVQPGGQ